MLFFGAWPCVPASLHRRVDLGHPVVGKHVLYTDVGFGRGKSGYLHVDTLASAKKAWRDVSRDVRGVGTINT